MDIKKKVCWLTTKNLIHKIKLHGGLGARGTSLKGISEAEKEKDKEAKEKEKSREAEDDL